METKNILNNYKRSKRKDKFLKELAGPEAAGSVVIACERAGLGRTTVYGWRNRDAIFEAEWDDALARGEEHLYSLAISSLVKNLESGNPTITVFTLKNKNPDKWKDGEDKSKPIDNTNYNEYLKQCEREGLDPTTGLPKSNGSSQVESTESVSE